MTPKEKADEIVSKMLQWQVLPEKGFVNEKTLLNNAKESALLAVEEIINDTLNPLAYKAESNFYLYWEEVRQQISLL